MYEVVRIIKRTKMIESGMLTSTQTWMNRWLMDEGWMDDGEE